MVGMYLVYGGFSGRKVSAVGGSHRRQKFARQERQKAILIPPPFRHMGLRVKGRPSDGVDSISSPLLRSPLLWAADHELARLEVAVLVAQALCH
jgi:hypothetical protein